MCVIYIKSIIFLYQDECVFDQCIAARTGDDQLKEEWLNETKGLVEQEVKQQNDTEVYTGELYLKYTYFEIKLACKCLEK